MMSDSEVVRIKREEEDYYLKRVQNLPRNDKEAEKRYRKYMRKDPYPGIDPALLNSADIFKYVAKTGMLHPFYVNKLEGASYEVAMKGDVIWWDEDNVEHKMELNDSGDTFELKPNSIAFITLEPEFRIPDYIALRFNLKIVHVYKGLLLGTGPLVDPGFVGRLSIPLHNLTANTYVFHGGDGIIQMEFTKLSRNNLWVDNSFVKPIYSGLYKRKWIRPGRNLKQYITKALGASTSTIVKSSIPDEIIRIKGVANATKEEVETTKKSIEKNAKQNLVLNIAVVVPIATIVISLLVYVWSTIGTVNSLKDERIAELEKAYNELLQDYNDSNSSLSTKISELEAKLAEIEKSDEEKSDGNGEVNGKAN